MSVQTRTLTNGQETFPITDEGGYWHDRFNARYKACSATCDHKFAPAGATVWHDTEGVKELWESPTRIDWCQCEGCKGKHAPAIGIVQDTGGVAMAVCQFHYECAIENGWRDAEDL